MRVSFNWLQSLLSEKIEPDTISHTLTKLGLEVEGEEFFGEEIDKVVIGYVKEKERHPNADKLSVCKVDAGEDNDNLQIICGAPNVEAGQKVPVALPGAKLPGGFKIKKAKLRGIESCGMICSAKELGIPEVLIPPEIKEGIWVLDKDAPIGSDFKCYSGLDDIVFEIGLTPNRADCLSMLNVAREVRAVVGGELKLPQVSLKENDTSIKDKISIEIKSPELCSRYVARIIENVKVGPSPKWLKKRLRSYGIRSINNVVDVTNYVMVEMGQPLHAFDYDLLKEKKIIVRNAFEGEKIKTLDEVERTLTPNMLVIADGEKPVAIAGVMGGFDTEVTDRTVNILLESAYFNPASIRHTSRKLGLRSEASNRYEKGIDKEGSLNAVNRAAQLLQLFAEGEVVAGAIDNYPRPFERKNIRLRESHVNQILGTELKKEYMKDLLERLSFLVKDKDEEILEVEVPSYRQDISREIDLIEEIARLHGYENIETTLPSKNEVRVVRSEKQIIEEKVCKSLAASGLSEIITYSFISPRSFDKLNISKDNYLRNCIEISNPLSEEQSVMRTTMIPGLLEVAARNNSHRIEEIAVFEIGRVFYPTDNLLPEEVTFLSGLVMGNIDSGWKWQKTPMDFYYCKGIIEKMLKDLGIIASFEPLRDLEYLHPGRTARVLINNKVIGYLGEIHPLVAEKYDLHSRAYVFELDLELLINLHDKTNKYKPLPKYPSVSRDLAIVLAENILATKVEEVIKRYGKPLVSDVKLFDIYKGEQIKKGYKSLAYSIKYQSDEKTLTDEEVNLTHEKIIKELETQINAKLR